MAISSVTSANLPPPPPQPEVRQATRNTSEVPSDQTSDNSVKAPNAPPPNTSPQGKMVGSLVDTKA